MGDHSQRLGRRRKRIWIEHVRHREGRRNHNAACEVIVIEEGAEALTSRVRENLVGKAHEPEQQLHASRSISLVWMRKHKSGPSCTGKPRGKVRTRHRKLNLTLL